MVNVNHQNAIYYVLFCVYKGFTGFLLFTELGSPWRGLHMWVLKAGFYGTCKGRGDGMRGYSSELVHFNLCIKCWESPNVEYSHLWNSCFTIWDLRCWQRCFWRYVSTGKYLTTFRRIVVHLQGHEFQDSWVCSWSVLLFTSQHGVISHKTRVHILHM